MPPSPPPLASRTAPSTTAAALLLALGGPPLLVLASRGLLGSEPRGPATQLLLQLVLCAIAVVVVLFVRRFERLPLSSIGLRPPDAWTVPSGLLLALGVHYLFPPLFRLLRDLVGQGDLGAGLRGIRAMPGWLRVFVAVTSGAVEETLYRGFAVERLSTIAGGRRWLGGLLASVAFALAHVPAWGLGLSLGADLPFGILMTLFYLWRRDLVASSIAHGTGLVVRMLAV